MLTINLNPFPVLSTKRFILRQLQESDAEAVFELRSNPVLMQYIARPLTKTVEDARVYIRTLTSGIENNESITWAIAVGNTVIGSVGYVNIYKEHHRAEVGYIVHGDYHRQGIIKEVLPEVLQYGFQTLHFHSIEAIINPANVASARVLESCGFVKEAHFKEKRFFNGQYLDDMIYSLLTPLKK
ncbi:MAG: GNAT family N-acetyltransferase [Siphonobacter sp.]